VVPWRRYITSEFPVAHPAAEGLVRLAATRFSSAASFFGGHFFTGVVYISSVSFATRAKKIRGCVARLSILSRDSSRVIVHIELISSMRGLSPFAAFQINLGLFSTHLFFSFGKAFSSCSTHSWLKLTLRHKVVYFSEFVSPSQDKKCDNELKRQILLKPGFG